MKLQNLHSWNLTPKEAVALQERWANHLICDSPVPFTIRTVAGVDVSYHRHSKHFHAAVVVLDYRLMDILETSTATGHVDFPYIPGLLSFRELPVVLKAFESLRIEPDVVLADAQGIAHPRRLGLASHLGLWLDLPTIGCAKSRLCGEHQVPGEGKGAWTILWHNDIEVGRVVRTKDRVKPLFVSPGHKIGLDDAKDVTLNCCRGYRMPEPTRQAHLLSNKMRLHYGA